MSPAQKIPPPGFDDIRINRAPKIDRCEPGWRFAPLPLREHDFWYVIEGKGEAVVGDRTFPLSAGSYIIYPPASDPSASQHPAYRLELFIVRFDLLDNRSQPIETSQTSFPRFGRVRDTAFFLSMIHRCERDWRHGDPTGLRQARLLFHQMLLQLWDEAFRPPPTVGEAQIQEVLVEIQKDPGKRWSVDMLARRCQWSRTQLTRRFRAATGVSPVEFLIRTRLERANRLIEETDMTLSQIADALGYRDVYFFSRQYKKFLGQPPSRRRQSGSAQRISGDAPN